MISKENIRKNWPLLQDPVIWYLVFCVYMSAVFFASIRSPTEPLENFFLLSWLPSRADAIDLIIWSPLIMFLTTIVLWRLAANKTHSEGVLPRADRIIASSLFIFFASFSFFSNMQVFIAIGLMEKCQEGPHVDFLWTLWDSTGPIFHCFHDAGFLAETPSYLLYPAPLFNAWGALLLSAITIFLIYRSARIWFSRGQQNRTP